MIRLIYLKNRENFLVVQGLKLYTSSHTSNAGAQVRSLVRELRSCMPFSMTWGGRGKRKGKRQPSVLQFLKISKALLIQSAICHFK